MATFRNARKSGKIPEQKIVKADNLKIEPVVEIEEQPVVKETKKFSRKNSTQDNQLLGGN